MEKSYNLRIRQEFCLAQIGRKVRILLMYLPEKKKHNDIHTDMQYIIKKMLFKG